MLHRYQRPASRLQALLGDVVVLIIPWRAVLVIRACVLFRAKSAIAPPLAPGWRRQHPVGGAARFAFAAENSAAWLMRVPSLCPPVASPTGC